MRRRASRASWTVSRTLSSGNKVAAWNVRPRPWRARTTGDDEVCGCPNSSTEPLAATKPPTAFIRVDLPAPLVPMRPTISCAPTSRLTPSTARLPPNRTETSSVRRATASSAGASRSGPRRGDTAIVRAADEAGTGSWRRSTQSSSASRTPYTACMSPPGKYSSRTSRPTLEVSRGTRSLLGKKAGSPTTHRAPRIGPPTEPRPPMTTIETSVNESFTVKNRSKGTCCTVPAMRAPPSPAMPPARAKACSFTRVERTV